MLVYIYFMHWIMGIRRNYTRYNCHNFVLFYTLFILVYFLHVTEITYKFRILPIVKVGEFCISNAQHAFGFTSFQLQFSWICTRLFSRTQNNLTCCTEQMFPSIFVILISQNVSFRARNETAFLNYIRSFV